MGSRAFQGTVCPALETHSLLGWCQVAGKRPGDALGSVTGFGDTTPREQDRLPWPGACGARTLPQPRPPCRRLHTSLSPWMMSGEGLPATHGRLAVGKRSGPGRHSWTVSPSPTGLPGLPGDSPWLPGAETKSKVFASRGLLSRGPHGHTATPSVMQREELQSHIHVEKPRKAADLGRRQQPQSFDTAQVAGV